MANDGAVARSGWTPVGGRCGIAGLLAAPARRGRAFDLLVAATVAVLATGPFAGPQGVGVLAAMGLAMAAALVARRAHPLAVHAVVCALALLQVVLFAPGTDPRPFDVAVLISM